MSKRTYCGLVWAERGNPSYYCVVTDIPMSTEGTFDDDNFKIEIIQEGIVDNYAFLKEFKKLVQ